MFSNTIQNAQNELANALSRIGLLTTLGYVLVALTGLIIMFTLFFISSQLTMILRRLYKNDSEDGKDGYFEVKSYLSGTYVQLAAIFVILITVIVAAVLVIVYVK